MLVIAREKTYVPVNGLAGRRQGETSPICFQLVRPEEGNEGSLITSYRMYETSWSRQEVCTSKICLLIISFMNKYIERNKI